MGQYKGKQGGFGGPKGGDRGGDRYPKRDNGGNHHFKSNRDEGRKDFGSRPDMHTAICSDCGNTCEVPFRPTGDKPVYCNNCFAKHRGNEAGGYQRPERKDFGPNQTEHNRGERRPESRPGDNSSIHDLKRRVDELHAKIDRLLDTIDNTKKRMVSPVQDVQTNLVPKKIKKLVSIKKESLSKKPVKKEIKKMEKKKTPVKKKK
ncbi:MAG: hypothetical protein KBB88_01260 [Candidatus Pacebacteria bacterium]|nr:hypothetical protein [Candidatus Paceibacterota bacterium]